MCLGFQGCQRSTDKLQSEKCIRRMHACGSILRFALANEAAFRQVSSGALLLKLIFKQKSEVFETFLKNNRLELKKPQIKQLSQHWKLRKKTKNGVKTRVKT